MSESIPLTEEQKQAIADGRPTPGNIDFAKLPREEQELVFQHVTGRPMPQEK